MSMITASIWVPRGAAAAFPEKYDVDENELSRISKLAKLQLEEANESLEEAQKRQTNGSEMDDSEDEEEGEGMSKAQEYEFVMADDVTLADSHKR